MAVRGRKPKPAALRLITGNAGKRPINDQEPEPDGEIRKPGYVKGPAARLWKQYAPDLEAQGVLRSWDVDMLGAWCCLMADFQKDPQRFTAAQMSQMRGLASSFGLTPADRARLKTGGKKDAHKDPAAEFFGSG